MDDLHADLARFETPELDDSELVDFGQPPPELPVTEDGKLQANRLLGAMRYLDHQISEVAKLAEAERDRVARWEDERTEPLQRRYSWLAKSLEQFMRAHHATAGAVTLKLPNGTLKLPVNQFSVEVADQALAVKWLQENAPAATVRYPDPPEPAVAATELKKLVGVDGKPFVTAETGNRLPDGRVLHQIVDAAGEAIPGVFLARQPDERGFRVELPSVE